MGFTDQLKSAGFGSSGNALANSLSTLVAKKRHEDFNNDLLGAEGYLDFDGITKLAKDNQMPVSQVFVLAEQRNKAKLSSRIKQLMPQIMRMRGEEEYQGPGGVEKMFKDLDVDPYEISAVQEILEATKTKWRDAKNLDTSKPAIQTSESGEVRTLWSGSGEKTDPILEYEYSVKQGFKGSFNAWLAKKHKLDKSNDPEVKFSQETSLRKDFNSQAKQYKTVRDAHIRVEAAGKDPSAAGDLALIFNYMKVLDPGSTVREGEFATAQNSASVPERIWARYNKVLSGERLSDKTRNDFIDRSRRLYKGQEDTHRKLVSEYTKVIKNYGLRKENVLMDFIPDEFANFKDRKRSEEPTAEKPAEKKESLDEFWE
jgi:hypothetical protein